MKRPRPLPFQRALLAAIVGALLAAGGCGGSTYDDGVFRDAHDPTRFDVDAPEGAWRRVDVEGQNDLAFVSDDLGAVIQVNASCAPDLDIPLVALRNHLLIGFTERELVSEELVEMDGREALRTHTRAKLDGVPRELLLVVLKKNECVYDFALVAPPGQRFERAVPSFDGMLASFHTEGRTR